jgi:transposase
VLQAADLAQEVQRAVERGFRVVQLDECMVTTKTRPTHVWTTQKQNCQMDYKELQIRPKAILAAVSRELGLEYIQIFEYSVTKHKFKQYLQGLRNQHPFDDILLMMDNLSLHKSWETKEMMDELGFLYAYTPVYSPRYNGIEEVFSQAKHVIKKKRLDGIMSNQQLDLRQVILEAFRSIEPHSIAKCVARSLELLVFD